MFHVDSLFSSCFDSGSMLTSHFAQKYGGMDQLYSIDKILQLGPFKVGWWPTMLMLARMFSYRGMTAKKETTKSLPNRLHLMGLYLLMILACEIHAIVLSFYPPKNWKDMISILCGSFVVAAVCYKLSPVGAVFLPESSYDHLVIEKTPLTDVLHV
jgi:hypothetical protein